MKHRRLGKTSLQVSEIGFGAWAVGGPVDVAGKPFGWGPVDEDTARAAVHRAYDLGVNFFDTADVYGFGRSESILGDVLRGRDVIIATKAGNVRTDKGEAGKNFTESYLSDAVDKSLKRLRRDVVDVFQLHNPSVEDIRRGDCLQALESLRKAGKIRFTGVSIHRPDEGTALLSGPFPIDTIQVVYNLINTRMAERVLPLAIEEDIGVIARVPLQYGLLAGKYDRGTQFGHDDHRSWSLKPEVIDRGLQLLGALKPGVTKLGLTPAQFALKFALAHPAVAVTIPGARTPEQAQANARTSDGRPLPAELLRAVGEAQRAMSSLGD